MSFAGLGGLTLGGAAVTAPGGTAAGGMLGLGTLATSSVSGTATGLPSSNCLMLVNLPNILGELDVSK